MCDTTNSQSPNHTRDMTHPYVCLDSIWTGVPATHRNTPQHTATHRNTPQHTATHRNTLQHTATFRNTSQHTAAYCNADNADMCVPSFHFNRCISNHWLIQVLVYTNVPVCCSVLQSVAECCSVYTHSLAYPGSYFYKCCRMLQCLAVSCRVLQSVAACTRHWLIKG